MAAGLLAHHQASLPRWGLVAGKHSVDTCKGLLFHSAPEDRIPLAGQSRLGAKVGAVTGWLPGGGGLSGCVETWALQTLRAL